MNTEEKNAVEFVKKRTKELKKYAKRENELVYDDIILNLIEKLQKENEELRESNKKLYEIGQEMCKQDKYTRENYISVQKVKDKIEKLKQERTLKYDNYMGYKIESREQQDIDKKVQVLQELLDGSDTSVGSIGSED